MHLISWPQYILKTMSKDSGNKPGVQHIFDNMDYGPVSEGKSLAEVSF